MQVRLQLAKASQGWSLIPITPDGLCGWHAIIAGRDEDAYLAVPRTLGFNTLASPITLHFEPKASLQSPLSHCKVRSWIPACEGACHPRKQLCQCVVAADLPRSAAATPEPSRGRIGKFLKLLCACVLAWRRSRASKERRSLRCRMRGSGFPAIWDADVPCCVRSGCGLDCADTADIHSKLLRSPGAPWICLAFCKIIRIIRGSGHFAEEWH